MSASDQTILDGVHLKERASKASNYTMNPSEIAELATSGETEPLLPDSAPLARHKVAEVKKLAFTTGGGMGAGKVAEFGASALGETLGPVASGVGGGLNALHTGSQAARLAALDGGDHETGGAIDQLTANRGKKAATQVGKTAAAATTGFFTGAAVGTAIPVPILGTVVGALVGGLVGFAAGKAVEIFGDKALQDPIDDYHAVLKLHAAVLAGNAAALEAFEFLGVDKATAQAPDGWKALVAKVGASPS